MKRNLRYAWLLFMSPWLGAQGISDFVYSGSGTHNASALNLAAEDTIYFITVEEMPEPIGGLQAIQRNVVYPEIVRRAGIEGTVYVEVFINEAGDVVRATIVKGVHPALNTAAVAALEKTKFKPGRSQGRPVKVRLSVPIRFRIGEKGETLKHALYPGNYPMSAGAFEVSEKAKWRTLNTKAYPDKVLLILDEGLSEGDRFWSVMSYLTAEEARELARLLEVAAGKVSK